MKRRFAVGNWSSVSMGATVTFVENPLTNHSLTKRAIELSDIDDTSCVSFLPHESNNCHDNRIV